MIIITYHYHYSLLFVFTIAKHITPFFFYCFQETHELALLAAGSTIDLVDAVMAGKIQNGMALIR